MTPSERLHRLHERQARRIEVEPMTPQSPWLDAMRGTVRDMAAIMAVTAFLIAIAVWLAAF